MSSKQNNLSNWTKPKIWYLLPDICIFSCQPCLRTLVQVTSSAFFFFDNPFNLSFLLVFLFLDYLSNYNTTYIVTRQVHLLYPQELRNVVRNFFRNVDIYLYRIYLHSCYIHIVGIYPPSFLVYVTSHYFQINTRYLANVQYLNSLIIFVSLSSHNNWFLQGHDGLQITSRYFVVIITSISVRFKLM